MSDKATEPSDCSDKELQEKMLIEQYRRCVEDWRRYDSYLWQIPFGTFTAVGAILTIAVREEISRENFLILINFLCLFVITMMFSAMKTRLFQDHRAIFAENIERWYGFKDSKDERQTERADTRILKINTKDVLVYLRENGIKKCWAYKISAYHLQIGLFLAIFFSIILSATELDFRSILIVSWVAYIFPTIWNWIKSKIMDC